MLKILLTSWWIWNTTSVFQFDFGSAEWVQALEHARWELHLWAAMAALLRLWFTCLHGYSTELLPMCPMTICVCSLECLLRSFAHFIYLFSYSVTLAGYKLTTLLTQPFKVLADGQASGLATCVMFKWLFLLSHSVGFLCLEPKTFIRHTTCGVSLLLLVVHTFLLTLLWCRTVFKSEWLIYLLRVCELCVLMCRGDQSQFAMWFLWRHPSLSKDRVSLGPGTHWLH